MHKNSLVQMVVALITLALVGLVVGTAQASGSAVSFYGVSIPVLDQSDGERKKALRGGLEKVLVQVSGQTEFDANSGIQQALANPESYLQEFGYTTLSEAEKNALRAEAKNRREPKTRTSAKAITIPELKLNANFSQQSIKTLLRSAGVPVWPRERPSVLAWIVIDSGSGKQMLAQISSAQAQLLMEAGRRGLPVVLPMNDLNDQLALGAERLWELDQSSIREASQRYGEDSILAGKIAQIAPGEWQGSWLYLLKAEARVVEITADDLEDSLAAGLNVAVQAQVERYGIQPQSAPGTVSLQISDVGSFARYTKTLQYLAGLDPVKRVVVTDVNKNIMSCKVEIDGGDKQILRELVELGTTLKPEANVTENAVVGTDTPESPLQLRFVAQ